MKCPYCAEEIQDAAVLCRFCGARKLGGSWLSPGSAQATKKDFTIVSSGWLLMVSSVWSLITVTAPVVILGGFSGVGAVLYNATFAGLFGAMGFALAQRRPWALPITLATSLAYTLDKLAFVLDESAQTAALGEAGAMLGEMGSAVTQVTMLVSLLFLLGWWGFVFYLYMKRDYFRPEARSGTGLAGAP